jgi:lantibiotic modifying enzyme
LKTAQVRQDIEVALEEVAAHYWMDSHCLCHGSLGNLEPILVASEWDEFEKWTRDLPEQARLVTADVIARGWRSMLPNQTLGVDLFTGLSGLGYGYLRLHAPHEVPSVLLLGRP